MNSMLNNKLDKAMTTEQFTQVVDAILEGQYSWACVLILRFAGYNPLHYIPYRTYNRLMKDHSEMSKRHHDNSSQRFSGQPLPKQNSPKPKTHQIRDLSYLESLNSPSDLLAPSVKGGYCVHTSDLSSGLATQSTLNPPTLGDFEQTIRYVLRTRSANGSSPEMRPVDALREGGFRGRKDLCVHSRSKAGMLCPIPSWSIWNI